MTDLVPAHTARGPCVVSKEDIARQCGKETTQPFNQYKGLSPNQLFLYLAVHKSLLILRHGKTSLVDGPVIVLMVLCWLSLFGCSWVSQLLTDVVAGLWAAAFLIACLRGLKIGSPKAIRFPHDHRDRLILGSIVDVFNPWGTVAWLIQNVVMLAVLQFLLIWYTSGHLGVSAEMSIGDAALLTVDTISQSVSLGIFESFHPRLSPLTENAPFLPTSIFVAFKTCYIGYMVVIVVSLYQQFKHRSLLPTIPAWGDVDGFVKWLRKITRPTHAALVNYPDELLFFLILQEYLRGNFQAVKLLADRFSSILVANSVRSLFVEPASETLLFPQLDGYDDDNKSVVISPK